jgi:hypothetical protein
MGGFSLSGRGGHRGPKATFTPEQRASYVRRARQLLAQPGTTVSAAAERLGLNPGTLYGWLRKPDVGAFLSVTVIPESTALIVTEPVVQVCRPVVVSPGGYRVEGLDVDAIAELLGKLS